MSTLSITNSGTVTLAGASDTVTVQNLTGGLDAPIAVTLTLSGTDQLSLTGLTGENRGFDDAGDGGSVDNVMLAAGAT